MYEKLLDLNNLHSSFLKSKSGVDWKSSVQRYGANELYNINCLKKTLVEHSYRQKPFFEFDISERGKRRHIRSLHISDRVLQRALCDCVLSPVLRSHLIYDNGASQKGKGIEFTRNRLKVHLEKFYRKYKDSGYVLLIDFSKYFDNIRHDKTMEMFEKYIDDKNVIQLLSYLVSSFDTDTVKRKGVGIGSQISQEIGIAYPIPIDNYCKIVKGCKYYGRYMDDTYVIHNDKKFLQNLLKEINNICGELGIVINKKKTQIVKLSNGFRFLKMRYKFTPTGKIVVVPDRKSMTRERRKLKKLKIKLDSRKISYEEIEGQYKSWRGGLSKYNSYRSLQNADRLYMKLFNRRIIWTKKKNRSVRKSTLKSDALSHSSQPRQAQLATGRLSSATRQN